jgi:hypothetical protein
VAKNDVLGISGIVFARFFLDIHPEAKIVILEAGSCIGGVWSSCKSSKLSILVSNKGVESPKIIKKHETTRNFGFKAVRVRLASLTRN